MKKFFNVALFVLCTLSVTIPAQAITFVGPVEWATGKGTVEHLTGYTLRDLFSGAAARTAQPVEPTGRIKTVYNKVSVSLPSQEAVVKAVTDNRVAKLIAEYPKSTAAIAATVVAGAVATGYYVAQKSDKKDA